MSKGKTDEISQTLVPDFHYSFKYTESDNQTNSYLLISYDSKTRLLKSSTDLSGTNVSEKAINDADDNELSNSIRSNRDDFFDSIPDYSIKSDSKGEDQNTVLYSLTVTVKDDVHTTKWANASKDLPDSIIKIVDEIKKLSIKKKII
ncbi:MAG TPA: hypothetical protein VH796_07610 [Nitrososphaeraceae archaeon]|jgi:hypothetical protein